MTFTATDTEEIATRLRAVSQAFLKGRDSELVERLESLAMFARGAIRRGDKR